MAIEDHLDRIATALERLTNGAFTVAAETDRTPETTAAPAAPAETAEPEATIETVRDALRTHAKEHGRDSALAILTEFDVKSASKLDPTKFAAIVDRLRKPVEA